MSIPLLLDENVSPALVEPLWTHGIDTIHVRNRGWLGVEDHVIWAHAMEQARTVVTMDIADFRRLALRERSHPGILTIPSGGSRAEQLDHVMTAITWASNGGVFANRLVDVSIMGEIQFEVVTSIQSNQPIG
jgi:predicted nuclease of predicted toxin-antitoxin system